MATPTDFHSDYNVGDTGFIFTTNQELGYEIGPATITRLDFRDGFDPNAFDPANDFIYTTNVLKEYSDPQVYVKVRPNKFFATVAALQAYITSLGL